MKHTAQVTYQYDPANQRLFIFEDGRHLGGFMGAAAERQFAKLLDTENEINIKPMDKEMQRKSQVRRLRAIWIKQGVDKYRESILEAYGVSSTADLSLSQLKELIIIYSAKQPAQASQLIRKLRSESLRLLTMLGVYEDQNWDAVNNFMMDSRIAGKPLYELNEKELIMLNRKLRAIESKQIK